MTGFLSQAVAKILAEHNDLRKLALVMPSRRAAVFLQKELQNQLQKTAFAPAFLTVEDLIAESTGLQTDDQPALLFKAYEAYRSTAELPESFAEFSKWGHLLLADFNEVDRYLVEAEKLFDYLADVRRIESWNLEPQPNELIQNYLALWRSLPAVYKALKERLLSEKRSYQGLAYRQMAENMPGLLPRLKEQYAHFYFLGFNALNTAEEKIFMDFYEAGLASFYWDVDAYYFNDTEHEAGQFLRQSPLLKRLRQRDDFHGLHKALTEESKNVESISVSGNHLQGVVANQILEQYRSQHWETTAVVLADEALLPAFLHNLNQDIPSLNITMGLPLENSPLAGFFNLLLSFQVAFERKKRTDKNGRAQFYHQQWDDLLSSLITKRLIEDNYQLENIRHSFRQRNLVYASYAQLLELGFPTLFPAELFEEPQHISDYFKALAQFCEGAKAKISQGQTEALYGFYKLFNQLAELFTRFDYVSDFETARYFFRDLLRQVTIDILGEPLSGLQVMGMLETRTLDFENVIITSLNEDILPKGRSQNSLIPFDIKREYGLPTFLDKDAVYAYHFYRLLHRAKNVHLIYNTAADGIKVGEASRFIKQVGIELRKEHEKKHLKSSFTRRTANSQPRVNSLQEREIAKTPAVMERLHQLAEKGFSPTALREYLISPLDFYYNRVLHLQEAEEVDEEIDFRAQGNVIHELLEKFYGEKKEGAATRPYNIGASSDLFSMKRSSLQAEVEQELSRQLALQSFDSGRNMLTVELLSRMLANFLHYDQKRFANDARIKVKSLEEPLEWTLKINSQLRVKIHGKADRVDQTSQGTRIIDYKTGGDTDSDFNLTRGLEQLREKPKAIQLLTYGYLYLQNHPELEQVFPSILSLRKLNQSFLNLTVNKAEGMESTLKDEFEDYLKELILEIFNPDIPFRNTQLLENED